MNSQRANAQSPSRGIYNDACAKRRHFAAVPNDTSVGRAVRSQGVTITSHSRLTFLCLPPLNTFAQWAISICACTMHTAIVKSGLFGNAKN
eukprot:2257938-Amphidinium_carterae.1